MRDLPAKIIHLHHGGSTMRIISRLAGAQVVIQHVHNRVDESSGSVVARMLFRGADAVIACSQTVADTVTGCRPYVIYAGIEAAPKRPTKCAGAGPLSFGVLTRLIAIKKVEAVIDASSRLKRMGTEIQVHIAGSGLPESGLKALAGILTVGDRVHFLGWQTELRKLLDSWDPLVMPSLDEGLPNAALEAWRQVFRLWQAPLGEHQNLSLTGLPRLFPAADTDSMVRCIRELAGNREIRARMGYEALRRAESEFSAEKMASQIADLYDRLLKCV
jgi:glycosyltransferase involved in cell wall biosynthesis